MSSNQLEPQEDVLPLAEVQVGLVVGTPALPPLRGVCCSQPLAVEDGVDDVLPPPLPDLFVATVNPGGGPREDDLFKGLVQSSEVAAHC